MYIRICMYVYIIYLYKYDARELNNI